MSADDVLEAQGVMIKRGDGASPELFTSIAKVKTFQGPGGSADVRDVSDLASVAVEKKMGLVDEGQFTFGGYLKPSDVPQAALRADRTARTLRNFTLTLTDSPATVLSFSAYVLEFSIDGGVNDDINLSVTLEISGAVTWS